MLISVKFKKEGMSLIRYQKRKFRSVFPAALKMSGGIALACSLLLFAPMTADAFSLSGQSDTILRVRNTTEDKTQVPLYEYISLSLADIGPDGAIGFYFGGWGRVDLGSETLDRDTNGDLQYGYMTYRPKNNNLIVSLGRQFVAEGVATERLDGLFARIDLPAGFGASVFAGSPVATEPNFKIGGDVVYGGRISHTMPKYYTVGLSFLKNDGPDGRLREEEGIDLRFYPCKYFEAVGRSSYNSITGGFMENAYTATITPVSNVKINFDLSHVNYKDYFFNNAATSAFSFITGIIDPGEGVLSLGGSVAYTPIKNLTLAADYKNYNYDIMGNADYFGGKIAYSLPYNFSTGFSVHRMDGDRDTLRYYEYRVYASKRIGKLDLTADFFDVNYDRSINDIHNTLNVTGSASYDLTKNLRISANADYAKDTEFDDQVSGFLKVTYAFDMKFDSKGGATREK
jgi:hypothetical protein